LKLEPPEGGARMSLNGDTFDRKLASVFVALSGGRLVGYDLCFLVMNERRIDVR
jgi:hypothetical protein